MIQPTFTGDKETYTQSILEISHPRYATLEDFEALREFESTVFPEGGGLGYWRLQSQLKDNQQANMILEIDGRIVAHVRGDMFPSNISPNRPYGDITSLGVAEEYRGRGLGELMLGLMIDSMLPENPTGIMLHTRISNVAMQGLAAKFGFVTEQTEPDYYDHTKTPEDAYMMVYRIDAPAPVLD
jgi:ribosomal protein S18 acetylase RimI-like enzyme